MNKVTDRKIEVKPVSGEACYVFSKNPDYKIDTSFHGIGSWLSNRVDDYFDNLSSLRVYEQKRINSENEVTITKTFIHNS